MTTPKNPAAVALGTLGGSVSSPAKVKSSRANGRKGGRPKGSGKPPWAAAQWFEVRYRFAGSDTDKRVDRRRRTKETAERIATELRASGNYEAVWLVEVNRLTRDRDATAGNPRTVRRG